MNIVSVIMFICLGALYIFLFYRMGYRHGSMKEKVADVKKLKIFIDDITSAYHSGAINAESIKEVIKCIDKAFMKKWVKEAREDIIKSMPKIKIPIEK